MYDDRCAILSSRRDCIHRGKMISSRSVASLDMKTNCKHVLRYNGCTRWGSNCRKHHETCINTFVNVEIFRRHLSEKDISVPEFLAQGSRSIWSNDISGKNILWEVNGKNRLIDYWILQISVSVAVCGTGYDIKISFFTNHPITYRVCNIIIKFSFFYMKLVKYCLLNNFANSYQEQSCTPIIF